MLRFSLRKDCTPATSSLVIGRKPGVFVTLEEDRERHVREDSEALMAVRFFCLQVAAQTNLRQTEELHSSLQAHGLSQTWIVHLGHPSGIQRAMPVPKTGCLFAVDGLLGCHLTEDYLFIKFFNSCENTH